MSTVNPNKVALDATSQEVLVRFTSAIEASNLPEAAKVRIGNDAAELFAAHPGSATEKLFNARQQIAKELNTGGYGEQGIASSPDDAAYKESGSAIAKAFEAAQKLLAERTESAAEGFRARIESKRIQGSNLTPQGL